MTRKKPEEQHWVKKTKELLASTKGQDEMVAALKSAKDRSKKEAKYRYIDPSLLNEPVTI